MRRLRLLLVGRRATGERGAVLILTGFLVMFVAIGLLAITIDIGNATYNRAQLQNGSDAASLALAAACAQPSATGPQCGITASPTDPFTSLAKLNANAADQSMAIDTSKTCIGGKPYTGTTTLPACPAPPATDTSLSGCQPWPLSLDANAVPYVEVTTQTKMKSGSNILPYYFGQLLTGTSGSTHRTCSRAAWGPAGSSGATLPITMGQCDWNLATSGGTKYASIPPYSTSPGVGNPVPTELTSPTNYVRAIFLHTSDNAAKCTGSPGLNYPGGFGWLVPDNTSACTVTIPAQDPTAPGKPGNPPPCDLTKYVGSVIAVPIFGSTSGSGSGGTYGIIGVSAFYLAGYTNLTSGYGTDSVYSEPVGLCPDPIGHGKCKGSIEYVWGWFVSGLLPIGSAIIGTGPDLGAHVVVPAG